MLKVTTFHIFKRQTSLYLPILLIPLVLPILLISELAVLTSIQVRAHTFPNFSVKRKKLQ